MKSHHYSYRFPFARYPAIRLALLLVAGILLDHYLQLAPEYWLMLFVPILGCYLLFEYSNIRSLHTGKYRAVILCYIVGVVLFGALWNAIQTRFLRTETGIPQSYAWEELDFHGEIEQVRPSASGKYHLDISIDSTLIPDSLMWYQPYRLRAIADSAHAENINLMKLGSRIWFRATVYPLEGKRNPHEFDYKRYLASQGIYSQAGVDTIYSVGETYSPFNWNSYRQQVLDLIEVNFSEQTASLAKALLIGYKNELSRDEKLAYSRAGLSHIMAVSGLHVGFILAPFWLLIPYFWTLRWGKQTGLVLLLCLLFVYAGLTGFSASVTRASITGGFLTYGRLFHKVRDSKNLTALAALLILLADPGELFEIGFQLSFAAVYIILLVMPVINSWLPRWIRYRWYGKLILIVLVSLVVQAGLFPLLTHYFGEFSLIGPLINALVVPLLTFVVPYALMLLAVSAGFPVLGEWLNIPNQWFLLFLDELVLTASSWEGSWMTTQTEGPLIFIIWASAILTLAALNTPRLRWKGLCIFLGALCLQQVSGIHQKLGNPHLQVTIFDTGQGDAALIRTPLGKHFLIDTGRWSPGYNSARQIIIPHLKATGVNKLDAVFLSHPHADHIGGIRELMRTVPIDTIYNSGYRYDSHLYHSYLSDAASRSVPVKSLSAGERIHLDPSIRIFVYGPDNTAFGADPNEHSLVMEIVFGDTEFLFTGDAETTQEARVLKNFGSLTDTDFLKVAHHGSRTSSSAQFLNTITPEHAVVSLSKQNRFGHPHPEAIRRLRKSQARLCFTSLDGACVYYSDGTAIYRENWK